MRKKSLKRTTIAVIVVLLLMVLCWALIKAFTAPDVRQGHDHFHLSRGCESLSRQTGFVRALACESLWNAVGK